MDQSVQSVLSVGLMTLMSLMMEFTQHSRMAYIQETQEEIVDNMLNLLSQEYSPATAAAEGSPPEGSPPVVESSSSDSSTPAELSGLDVKQSFLRLIDQWQSHTPEVTTLWWKADDMAKVYDLLATPWWDLVQKHSAIHSLSRSPYDDYDNFEVIYLHTTRANFEQGCDSGDLGARFVFKSAGQTLLHRT
eukprot:5212147-Amphidinium_carterae.1